jgi:hypothetical protein
MRVQVGGWAGEERERERERERESSDQLAFDKALLDSADLTT